MECPKCRTKCIVVKKETYHPAGHTHPYEVRVYACQSLTCLHAFAYRNTFLEQRDRVDVARFIKQYNAKKEDGATLFDEEDD